jgi:hypothetical protein
MSPERENPSAVLGDVAVTGVIGALLDLECDRKDAGASERGGDKSDFAFSSVSPIATNCRFALFNENSAATDNVYGETRPFCGAPLRSSIDLWRMTGRCSGLSRHGGAPGGTGN